MVLTGKYKRPSSLCLYTYASIGSGPAVAVGVGGLTMDGTFIDQNMEWDWGGS